MDGSADGEADDPLCSRNARLKKALAFGRAQWKINQPPSLKKKKKKKRDNKRGRELLFSDARNQGQPRPLL